MKYACLDQEGSMLAVVFADSPEEALAKAPQGTMKVELMPERPQHGRN